MPLSKQMIPVVFSGGIDTKSAKQTVVQGKFLVLENCIRRKTNRVQKRFGFQSLGKGILGSAEEVTSGYNLSNFQDDLLLLNQSRIYSYAQANDAWVDKGELTTAQITASAVIRNSYLQASPDMANLQGLTLTVWEDTRDGVRCAVTNDSTGTSILYDAVVSATAVRPKCFVIGMQFFIVYIEPGDSSLRCRRIAFTNPTVLGSETTILAANVGDAPWDVVPYLTGAVFVIGTNASQTEVGYITPAGILGNPLTGYPNPVIHAVQSSSFLTIQGNQVNGQIYILSGNSSNNDVTLICMSSDFIITSITIVDATLAVNAVNGTTVVRTDDSVLAYYEVFDAIPSNHYIKTFAFTWAGAGAPVITEAVSVFKRSVGLASKAFQDDEAYYILTAFQTDLQPTYFLIKDDGFIVSKILPGTGNGLTTGTAGPVLTFKSTLPRVSTDAADAHIFPVQVRTKVEAVNDTTVLATNVGINKISADFTSVVFITDTLGDNMSISGGITLNYDGVSITEQGFNVFPEDLLTSQTADTGTFTAGDYVYAATYEWVDGKGQIHRSAPSTTVTVSVVTTTNQVNITVPKLRLTLKEAPRAPVKIVIYRSDVDLSDVLYKLVEISNDNTVQGGVIKTDDTVTFPDSNSLGPTLTQQEILYTTGGVLENIAPPACKFIHKHKNRLFIAGLEDSTLVEFSKEWVFGEGVAFSDSFQMRVDGQGGEVTALGTLDDKLIIFKRDRAFAVAGDGPVDTGAQNDYGIPQLISGDVGVAPQNRQSIVITPMGLMFKSDKGIYLLGRGLDMQYIGADVEAFNDLTISSSVVIEDENEVRFTTTGGVTLVYNYYFSQWSVFTNYGAASAVIALGSYLHLKDDGTVEQETPDQYLDNASRIKMAIETSWLSFANIQGFQRVYWISALGDYLSQHFTKIQLAYDFENVYTETVYYNTVSGQMQTVYGTDIYGDETPYGGPGSSVYQWRLKPRTQRCESIKVRLEDLDTITTDGGASFNLVALSFVAGVMRGVMRQGENRTLGK